MDWEEIIGSDPDAFCDSLYAGRPEWVVGQVSRFDARYLFRHALESGSETVIEVGTASGFSTAFLAEALRFAHIAGLVGKDFRVTSYDVVSSFYGDADHGVGEATRAMVSRGTWSHVALRNPATARDAVAEHEEDSVGFAFIDAAHRHPWPALDLMTLLEVLRPGAEVALHDINLPEINPSFPDFGAKWLFDDLDLEKFTDSKAPLPNIGSVVIPEEKDELRDQIREIVAEHPWEAEVSPEIADAVLS